MDNISTFFKGVKKKYAEYKNARMMKNRKVSKAKFLYWYILSATAISFLYAIVSLFFASLSIWYSLLTPVPLLLWFVGFLIKKNWKLISVYIYDTEQGRALLRLNDRTHFSEEHKLKLIKWIYPRPRQVRNETFLKLVQKSKDGEELTSKERSKIKKASLVFCPQQLLEGFNKALLIDTLIWCHQNITILDDDLREIMNLTDENIEGFDLHVEAKKAKGEVKADPKLEKLKAIGKRKSERKNA